MIKSPEKQYNAYRILKVLSNQDYLAVDYSHFYYILSPVKNRSNSLQKSSSFKEISEINDEAVKILQARQCIELDHIHYFVFAVGKSEIDCANSTDLTKFHNQSYLLHFFVSAIRGILKYFLLKQAKQVRKFIDIKNAIIVKGSLYIIELNRGKYYPRSLQKSQKIPNQKNKSDSFQNILENELKIIKYFGLLLWQIIFKSYYTPKTQKKGEVNIIEQLMMSMINKQITYEYLQIKIREEEQKIHPFREKKQKKMNFLIKKDKINRYQTQSMNNETRKSQFKRILTQDFNHYGNPHLLERKNRIVSEINTGSQSIQSFSRRIATYNTPKVNNRWINAYQSAQSKIPIRELSSKLSEKFAKQGQIAKNKFKKFLDSRFILREQKDQINESLRSKLMSKIQRFKTEQKNYSIERNTRAYSHSQNKFGAICEQQQMLQPKRLQFSLCKKVPIAESSQKLEVATIAQNKNTIQQIEINRQTQNYLGEQKKMAIVQSKMQISIKTEGLELQQNINQKQVEVLKQVISQLQQKQEEKLPLIEGKQIGNQQIQFQKIIFQNIPHFTEKELINNKLPLNQQQKGHLSNILTQIQNKQGKQGKEGAKNQENIEKQQKINQFNKRKKLVSQDGIQQGNEEIEVVKIVKTISQKPQIPQKITSAPLKPKIKALVPNKVSLEDLIEQYQYLINILGDICSRAIHSKVSIFIQWQKPIYFIYQRFLYERLKFEEALSLGARHITRNNDQIDHEQWDKWLQSQHRKSLILKIQNQNMEIKPNFNVFATKVLKECKFERKIEYYIRNRDKYGEKATIKNRQSLAKLTMSYIIQIFDKIVQSQIKKKEALNFLLDCLYGSLIICQLDFIIQQSQKVSLLNYKKYSYDIQQVCPIIELLESLYFNKQESEKIN